MEIVPQGNRVLVEFVELNKSGIVMPENISTPDYAIWRVVAVGEGQRLENGELVAISLKEGDEVAIHPTALIKMEPAAIYGDRKIAIAQVEGIVAKVVRAEEDRVPRRKIATAGELVH